MAQIMAQFKEFSYLDFLNLVKADARFGQTRVNQ
jgi:hypothetical protein